MTPGAPLGLLGVGLVSGVGLTAAASCAAIRCGLNNFQETPFLGSDGEWLIGSPVELGGRCRGIDKFAKMAARAVSECLDATDEPPDRIPLLLCVAEPERPGRLAGAAEELLQRVERELGIRLHADSRVIEQGRIGASLALLQARRVLADAQAARIIVAGVDSFLNGATLSAYDRDDRLVRGDHSNGFIPGEAAGAVLVAPWQPGMSAPLVLRGMGFARESATQASGKPLRADGLTQAIREALIDAQIPLKDCDHRITDMNGEQYRFKEAALAITRLLRDRKVMFSVWHPADCLGEVGAATLPAMVAMLFTGARKQYLPGPTFLAHLGNDDDKRTALVIRASAVERSVAAARHGLERG